MSKIYKQILETKYLAVENAWRYRAIMRTFYLNDQRYKHYLKKEEVYNALKEDEKFHNYTLELCQSDLESLVEWGNLNANQDTAKVMSYKQFINKQYRYQMTEYAIEIERMTIRLENLTFESGSLEPRLLERIKEQIKQIPYMIDEEVSNIGSWWSQLTSDFQRLNHDYQDYIRDWNSVKADEMMKTESFLLYKEKLVSYLRRFIKELQLHGFEIERTMKSFDADELNILFEKITAYEMDIPRLEFENITEKERHLFTVSKYMNMKHFFISSQEDESEVEKILTMTNEIIRKITRYAASIIESSSQYSSRKEEYLKMAKMFSRTESIDEAHLLSSQVFGISHYIHFAGELTRETEDIHSSIYDEAPIEAVLKPMVRTFREKLKKVAIIDNEAKKEAMREKVLEERKEEERILMSYLKSGQVVFKDLQNIEPKVRRTLLKWLFKAVNDKEHVAVTEHGNKYKLLNPNETERCVVTCLDGTFELPAYIMDFGVE